MKYDYTNARRTRSALTARSYLADMRKQHPEVTHVVRGIGAEDRHDELRINPRDEQVTAFAALRALFRKYSEVIIVPMKVVH